MSKAVWDLLAPERLTEVVDIGANPCDGGNPPYKPMLDAAVCHVTGFEPQERALAALQRKKGPNERYLPYAVGDGNTHTLYIYRGTGMASLLELDPAALAMFDVLQPLGEVVHRLPVSTRRLDDIAEVQRVDFLKIDIQGSELLVLQNGSARLAQAVAVQVEVSFVAIYKNQPCLGAIDLEMRSQGFIPHCFAGLKKCPLAPWAINGDPRRPSKQLLEADIVYVRDFLRPESMSDEQLKHLALIAHYCYGSVDLALRCMTLLVQRKALGSDTVSRYLAIAAKR